MTEDQSLFNEPNDPLMSSSFYAAVQPLNAFMCGQLMTFSGDEDKDPIKKMAPKLIKKPICNNDMPGSIDIQPYSRPVEESGGIEKFNVAEFNVAPEASDSDSQTDLPDVNSSPPDEITAANSAPPEAASVGTSLNRTAKNAISNELGDILSSACEQ